MLEVQTTDEKSTRIMLGGLALVGASASAYQLSFGRGPAAMPAPLRSSAKTTMQVNSDSRATEEYFDFLLGRKVREVTEDGPSVIVGDGKIGTMLQDFGKRRGFEDLIVKRGDTIPAECAGPVYVCVPLADVEAVVATCPPEKKDDLVFMQDGMLEPLFQRNGMYGPTQVIMWLVLLRKGGRPVDGEFTTVTGKWAGAVAMRFSTGGLTCKEVMDRDARRIMLEKLVFRTAYNLVGTVHGASKDDRLTVGDVATKHSEEVGSLCRELASFIRYTLSVSLFSGIDERLEGYAQQMEFLPTASVATDFEFFNGYFYKYAKMAGTRTTAAGIKVDIPDTTPMHTDYLNWAHEKGYINQALLDSV